MRLDPIDTISLAFNRRKAHRRAKRRAERARRKALTAAGFTDDQNSSIYDSALRAHLEEIDAQYGIRKRKKKQSAFVKTKVKRWRQGMRKRKENGDVGDDEPDHPTIYEEPKPMDPVDGMLRSSRHSFSTISLTSTPPSDEPTSQTSPTTTQESSDPNTEQRPNGTVNVDEDDDTRDGQPPPAFFGLPAYRPASVRSYNMHDASGSSGSSRPPGPSRTRSSPEYDDDQPRHVTDKVTAPGYYPAPATDEAEAALAVAQRSDGKAALRSPSPTPSEGTRRAHIATDDKQVLERMRLGGSAPSAPGPEADGGPSAPHVDVDADGFERLHLEPEESSSSTRRGLEHLPEPPRRKEARLFADGTDALHLLPSAPPVAQDESDYSGPSAPPMTEDSDEVPSAPPAEDGSEAADVEETPAGPTAPAIEDETMAIHAQPASAHGMQRERSSDSDLYS